MTEEQFSTALKKHLKSTKLGGKITETKGKIDARHVKINEADFAATCERLCKRLFEGKQTLEHADIKALRKTITEGLWHYEFYQYFEVSSEEVEGSDDVIVKIQSDGTISAQDFAKSILIFMPFNKYK